MFEMKPKKNYVIGIILIMVLFVVGAYFMFSYGGNVPSNKSEKIREGERAPYFFVVDLDGIRRGPSDFLGENIIIIFWKKECSQCISALENLKKLSEEFSDGLKILSINVDEPNEVIQETVEVINPGDNFIFLPDPKEIVYRFYDGVGVPYTIFIDKSGTIQHVEYGLMKLKKARTILESTE